MRKLFFAIGIMAIMSAASAAEAPAKGVAVPAAAQGGGTPQGPPPRQGCVFSPCRGETTCRPQFVDSSYAAFYLSVAEYPCDAGWQKPKIPQAPHPPFR